jgi:hypothetical protein
MTNFIAWAGFNGELVYTTDCMSFSFLENSKENVKKIIERGVSLQKEDGESFEEIEVCVNFLFDNGKISNNKIKGIHKIYTNVKINN